ncbi:MAG: hypothetical protein A2122_01480 [Candidatus Liptonbacteria bacterium GWB1_49_6]|uniref:Type 4 fimbrial biogenesis protein PilX N-terminal domain-containing protein n=1 Tax=Candidatus Liptonbacteria bacterium GWB1_49_6 TaxID=1798644 RepID=A0A1G2C7Z7_9BACT|nr:MAG: hypothetical protein A2122_01480 [Candidatus Liptonbacteria bacterium GWB1_49_6]
MFFGTYRKGQATLSLAILVGGTAVLIGLTLAFLTISFTNSSSGFQSAERALAVASAGADDALLRLVRNKDFPSSKYTLEVGSGNHIATVIVQNSSPVFNRVTITSQATVGVAQRKIEVIAEVDGDTGKMSVISWRQVVIK